MLEALLESSQLLYSSLDLDFLLQHLLRTVMGRRLVTKGLIAVADDEGMRLSLVRGLPTLEAGRPFVEEDATQAGIDRLYEIRQGEDLVGLLGLGRGLRQLDPAEDEFLKALMGIAATSIANARSHFEVQRLNEDLSQKVQDLNTLLEMVRSLTSNLDPETVAHVLALTLTGRWGISRYAVAAWKDGHPSVVRQRGLRLPDIDSLRDDLASISAPLLVADLPEGRLKSILKERKAEALFPLRTGEQALGAIALGARLGGLPLNPGDLEFGAGLAGQAVVAFENGWHFHETLEKRKIEQEIGVAASIQKDLFPSSLPELKGIEMAAHSLAARQVGGDYYDAIPVGAPGPEGPCLICVADISGKGIPASLLMSNIQATLRALLNEEVSVVDLVSRTSELLHATTPASKYATALILRLDPLSGEARYVNAGHNDGILIRASGEVEKWKSTGPPVGLLPGLPFGEANVELRPGDLLAVCSDGVVEAQDAEEEEFEEERFLEVLLENRELPVSEILEKVFQAIDSFVGDAPQHDDITLFLIRRSP